MIIENNDYYKIISQREYDKMCNYVIFSENQIKIIQDKYNNIELKNDIDGNFFQNKILTICAHKDEWFTVVDDSTEDSINYLCDQFDGLIKCLDDNL